MRRRGGYQLADRFGRLGSGMIYRGAVVAGAAEGSPEFFPSPKTEPSLPFRITTITNFGQVKSEIASS